MLSWPFLIVAVVAARSSCNQHRDLALLVARYHLYCHRALELRPQTLLKVFEALDLFRRPERLEPFLLACEADHRGRTGYEERPYPQAQRFRQAFVAANAVDSKPIAAQYKDLDGSAIGEKLRAARLEAIKKALSP